MAKLLPVIHVQSIEQAVRNALVAKNAGADGCFLIHHNANRDVLLAAYEDVRNQTDSAKGWWIGINDLGRNGLFLLEGLPDSIDGLWVDNLDDNKEIVDIWSENFASKSHQPMLFGGVAFKYQKKVDDVAQAAIDAVDYCDVVTTSGDATGIEPDVEKIKLMRNAIRSPLAIASGITLDNVHQYLPYVDYFLVATGISKNFNELDPDKVQRLASIIKGY